MTKLAIFHRRFSSIFRKRKVAPKKEDAVSNLIKGDEEETVRLEESDSHLSIHDSSCSFETPNEQVVAQEAVKPKTKKAGRVSFSDVTVRHYELVLGDNPYCKFPLALGWSYGLEETHKVDHFEDR